MQFKVKAKTPGRCAFAACQNAASKIYVDNAWKILACSQAHADIARSEIDKIPADKQKEYLG